MNTWPLSRICFQYSRVLRYVIEQITMRAFQKYQVCENGMSQSQVTAKMRNATKSPNHTFYDRFALYFALFTLISTKDKTRPKRGKIVQHGVEHRPETWLNCLWHCLVWIFNFWGKVPPAAPGRALSVRQLWTFVNKDSLVLGTCGLLYVLHLMKQLFYKNVKSTRLWVEANACLKQLHWPDA